MYRLLFVTLFLATCNSSVMSQQKTPCRLDIATDTVTHTRQAQANFSVVSNETDNLFCTAFRKGSSFSVYFGLEILNKSICFKPGSKAIIIFTDKSQIQLVNEQGDNCKGNFLINTTVANNRFTDKAEVFNALTEKVIRGIRFYSVQGFVDYDVTEFDDAESVRNADRFRTSVRCLKELDL